MTDITAPSHDSTGRAPTTRRGIRDRTSALHARARFIAHDETGAATAEYAIATLGAVALAGLLVVIMRSEEVKQILTDLVERALTVP